MTNKTKGNLKIILPIILIILLIITAILVIPKGISEKNYFNSLASSNYTKQEQITTIIENDHVIYEKVELVVIDGKNVYHKITEKQISDESELYDEKEIEFYYSNDYMYYFKDDEWKTMEFNVKNALKTYSFKKDYFINIAFDKKIEDQGILEGLVKDENVDDAFNSETEFHSASLKLIVNKNFKIQKCDIKAKTAKNRDVTVKNIFTYNDEEVVLPI